MKIFLPKKLDLDKIIQANPPEIRNFKKEHLMCMLGAINRVKTSKKEYLFESYTPLNSDILQKIHHDYKKYLEYAIDNGIIECDNYYIPGIKSLGYKFTDRYSLYDGIESYSIAIWKLKKKMECEKMPAKHKHLYRWFEGLQIDQKGAMEYCADYRDFLLENPQYKVEIQYPKNGKGFKKVVKKLKDAHAFFHSSSMNIKNLIQKNYRINVDDKSNRLHSVLTNMKKEVRNFLTYKGQSLVALDIRNSQPYFAIKLLDEEFYGGKKTKILSKSSFSTQSYPHHILSSLDTQSIIMSVKNLKTPENTDVYDFIEHTSKGKFYNAFSDKILTNSGQVIQDRQVLKEIMFWVLYSDNRCMNANKKLFKEYYPSIYELFKIIKKGRDSNDNSNKRRLPILLQSIESKMILDFICKRIYHDRPDLPIFTIHDSIVTTVGNELYLKNVMEEEMEKHIGYKPTLEPEYWRPENAKLPTKELSDMQMAS